MEWGHNSKKSYSIFGRFHYLSHLRLDEESRLNMARKAMTGSAEGWIKLNRFAYIHLEIYACFFIKAYCNEEKVEAQKKDLKSKRIDWQNVNRYSDKIYDLINKFKTLDETLCDQELYRNISTMLPLKLQRELEFSL